MKYEVGKVYHWYDKLDYDDNSIIYHTFIKILSVKEKRIAYNENSLFYTIIECEEDGSYIETATSDEWSEKELNKRNIKTLIEWKKILLNDAKEEMYKIKTKIEKLKIEIKKLESEVEEND